MTILGEKEVLSPVVSRDRAKLPNCRKGNGRAFQIVIGWTTNGTSNGLISDWLVTETSRGERTNFLHFECVIPDMVTIHTIGKLLGSDYWMIGPLQDPVWTLKPLNRCLLISSLSRFSCFKLWFEMWVESTLNGGTIQHFVYKLFFIFLWKTSGGLGTSGSTVQQWKHCSSLITVALTVCFLVVTARKANQS